SASALPKWTPGSSFTVQSTTLVTGTPVGQTTPTTVYQIVCPVGGCTGGTCLSGNNPGPCGSGATCSTATSITDLGCTWRFYASISGGLPCVPGQQCYAGACVCNANSCPGGCCSGNTCITSSTQPGLSTLQCGTGGNVCSACPTGPGGVALAGAC